jgi:hypothetical protein
MATNMEIANIILQQLGGTGKLKVMCGCKDYVAIENGVQFKVGKNAMGVNFCKIVLTADDLYDVEFGAIRNYEFKVKNKTEGAYNDMLKSLFESATGMYLSF